MQTAVKFLICVTLGTTVVQGSPNVHIWELLTHQEKMDRLMYVFSHLAHNYCKGSNIPDCDKVLTLYGMSNLVNEDNNALNHMDPYQRNSRTIIWERVMRGDFKLHNSKSFYSNSMDKEDQAEGNYDYINEVGDSPSSYQVNQRIYKLSNDPHPYAVRVPAPAKIATAHSTRVTAPTLVTSDFDKVEDNFIKNSDIATGNAASYSLNTSFDNARDYKTDNSEIAIGSSHPYEVKVLPESAVPEPSTNIIKSDREYEPMMVESKVHRTHALPLTLNILTGK